MIETLFRDERFESIEVSWFGGDIFSIRRRGEDTEIDCFTAYKSGVGGVTSKSCGSPDANDAKIIVAEWFDRSAEFFAK